MPEKKAVKKGRTQYRICTKEGLPRHGDTPTPTEWETIDQTGKSYYVTVIDQNQESQRVLVRRASDINRVPKEVNKMPEKKAVKKGRNQYRICTQEGLPRHGDTPTPTEWETIEQSGKSYYVTVIDQNQESQRVLVRRASDINRDPKKEQYYIIEEKSSHPPRHPTETEWETKHKQGKYSWVTVIEDGKSRSVKIQTIWNYQNLHDREKNVIAEGFRAGTPPTPDEWETLHKRGRCSYIIGLNKKGEMQPIAIQSATDYQKSIDINKNVIGEGPRAGTQATPEEWKTLHKRGRCSYITVNEDGRTKDILVKLTANYKKAVDRENYVIAEGFRSGTTPTLDEWKTTEQLGKLYYITLMNQDGEDRYVRIQTRYDYEKGALNDRNKNVIAEGFRAGTRPTPAEWETKHKKGKKSYIKVMNQNGEMESVWIQLILNYNIRVDREKNVIAEGFRAGTIPSEEEWETLGRNDDGYSCITVMNQNGEKHFVRVKHRVDYMRDQQNNNPITEKSQSSVPAAPATTEISLIPVHHEASSSSSNFPERNSLFARPVSPVNRVDNANNDIILAPNTPPATPGPTFMHNEVSSSSSCFPQPNPIFVLNNDPVLEEYRSSAMLGVEQSPTRLDNEIRSLLEHDSLFSERRNNKRQACGGENTHSTKRRRTR